MSVGVDLKGLKSVVTPKFYPCLENQNRHLVLWGGAGSGKSHFAAQKILLRTLFSIEAGVKQKFFAFRKTSPAARKSVFPVFKHYIAEWNLFPVVKKIRSQDMAIEFIDGSEIYCSGLDDPMKLLSVEGMTSAWVEEPTELKREDYLQLNLRLRGKRRAYKQIISTFNPISRLLWPHKLFFENPLKGISSLHSTVDDNPFIDDEYIAELDGLGDQDKIYHGIYRYGIWGVLKDLIYNNWDIVDELPKYYDEVIYGEDYGFNNPSCFGEIRIKENDVYIREIVYESKLTNPQLTEKALGHLSKERVCFIYADSAEPARIKEQNNIARERGYNYVHFIPSIKDSNSVKNGIDFCKRFKIHITKDSINGIKEMGSYKWREDKDDNTIDEPVKFMDHFCDMFRYALYTHMKEQRTYTAEDLSQYAY